MGGAIATIILIGVGATALLDLWTWALGRFLRQPKPNWALVGRWFAHLPAGRFAHDDIARAEPVANETAIGWIAHYAVGIAFAAGLLALWGMGWAANPTLLPALIVGWVTIGFGWFVLQPGMGAGVAASRRPNANQSRLLNLLGHTVFGIGLWATALLIR